MDILGEREEFLFDRKNIIDACVHQFPDEERWIVELILNSLDAGSSEISVSGMEEEEIYAIHVNDNGVGMDDTGRAGTDAVAATQAQNRKFVRFNGTGRSQRGIFGLRQSDFSCPQT